MAYRLIKPALVKFIFAWFCLFFIVVKSNDLLAQNFDSAPYIVNEVEANADGKTPAEARINAINGAQKNAFKTLLERLEMDRNIAENFDSKAIADMISSQQITNEKIADNNYSAILNIAFLESFVKHYLGNKNFTQNTSKPESILVLPIKIVKQQKLIWEENNDWKAAFEEVVNRNSNNSIKILKGDSDDMAAIKADLLDENNFTLSFLDVENILAKYKSDSLIVTYFEFDDLENKVNIYLKIVKKFRLKQVRLNFVNVNQLPMEDLISKVADKTLDYIAANPDNASSQAKDNSISNIQIDVLINNLAEWLMVKNKLENSKIVEQMKVNSISKDLVQITVSYNNSNGNIVEFFAQNNLYLQKKSDGKYFLTLKQYQ